MNARMNNQLRSLVSSVSTSTFPPFILSRWPRYFRNAASKSYPCSTGLFPGVWLALKSLS